MAIITIAAGFSSDIRTIDFGSFQDGVSYTTSLTLFVVDYGNGWKHELRGSGFTYNADKEFTGGNITGFSENFGSTRAFSIDQINIAASTVAAASRTTSTADDFAIIATVLAGNDTFLGGGLTDYFDGYGGNDTLNGNGGNDTLLGGAGNDTLNGGLGADTMNGGGGSDIFKVDNAADVTQEAAGQGSDTVFATVSYALASGQEIETFATASQGGTTAINLTGNAFGQRINGNEGNNVIYGGAGDDMLVGYGGNDNIEGQNGADTLKGISGVDKFVFRQSVVATSGADHISDFGADDFIYFDVTSGPTGTLNANAFRAGANALDADDRFIYYAPNKALYYDADGNGATAKVLFAVFDNGYTPTAADIVLF